MEVCRVCLASDTKLFDLEKCNLKVPYETLTNSLLAEDGLPQKLCWECRSRLLSCVRFRAKALCSQTLLTAMAPVNQYNIMKKLESIDRQKLNLTSSLSCTSDLDHIELDAHDKASRTEGGSRVSEEAARWAIAGAGGCGVSGEQRVRVKRESEWDGVSAESERDSLCYADHEFKIEVKMDTDLLQLPDHSSDGVQPVEETVLKTANNVQDILEAKPSFKNAIEEHNSVEKDLETLIHSLVQSQNALAASSKKHIKCIIESYNHKTDLKTRKKTHTNEKPYKCDHCNYNTAQKLYLKQHLLSKHKDEKRFKCNLCSYRSCRKAHLVTHQRTHTGEKPYKCSHCSYTCNTKSCLVKHERTHTGEKPYKCDICDYKAAQKAHLQDHLLNVHTDEKPFKCSHCTYKCGKKSHLLTHQKTHTGEKPYKCSYCSYTCSVKSNLLSHQRTHTGEKPYSCSQCSYKSTVKSNLLSHQRTHTGEKPFKCSHCSFTSSFKSSLQTHRRTHTGEKPYKCGICDYQAAHTTALKWHRKKNHANEYGNTQCTDVAQIIENKGEMS